MHHSSHAGFADNQHKERNIVPRYVPIELNLLDKWLGFAMGQVSLGRKVSSLFHVYPVRIVESYFIPCLAIEGVVQIAVNSALGGADA